MADQSALDAKYFIDDRVYNCPFCNRRNLVYGVIATFAFDWSDSKTCWVYFVRCASCTKISLHLSYTLLHDPVFTPPRFTRVADIDAAIFYHVPTSFFVIDDRVPRVLREVITEAEGCVKMNFLTGASACTRKAIYELTVLQKAQGEHYDDKITDLQTRFPNVDAELFEVLRHIKDMTSDKVHEQSWDKWDSGHIKLFLETLKSILYEMYVHPDERAGRVQKVRELVAAAKGATKQAPDAKPSAGPSA